MLRLMRAQGGFGVVEAMVAALILVIGGIAVLTAVDTAARGTYRAEQSQVQSNRLQQELERVLELPYDSVALTSAPAHSSNQASPSWRVNGSSYALNRNGTNLRPMVVQGGSLHEGGTITGAAVAPGPTAFTSGDVSGVIHRYVVWLNDDSCPESLCPGSQDKKRVIVASVLNGTGSGGVRSYQELHADIVDPDAERVANSVPPGQNQTPSWQFWLTDTPCDEAEREPIGGDHATHNTLGACDEGVSTSGAAGAPDLLFTEAPPLDPNFPPASQPLYDFATDVEPAVNPGQDKGLQMRVPSAGTPGCVPLDNDSSPEADKRWKTHLWLSPVIPSGFNVVLSGDGTLSLWTQTIAGATHPGRICAWLFTRQPNAQGQLVDTPVVNLDDPQSGDHFQHSLSSWPSNNWVEIDMPLRFAAPTGGAVQLGPGSRVGLAISVHRDGTLPGDGLQFNYDSPSFDSRLELKTDSNLPQFGSG